MKKKEKKKHIRNHAYNNKAFIIIKNIVETIRFRLKTVHLENEDMTFFGKTEFSMPYCYEHGALMFFFY